MKLLVFAHVPPPHHGQSYMVQLMLKGFGGDCRKSRNKSGARNIYALIVTTLTRVFQKSRRYRRTPNRQSPVGFVLLPSGNLVPVPLRCDQFLLCAARQVRALYRDWLVMFVCRRFSRKSFCTGTPPVWPNGLKRPSKSAPGP